MYDVLPPFWLVDAEVVGGGGEPVESIDDTCAAADKDDDEELGKKRAIGIEEWILDLEIIFLLGGIVKEVVNRQMWEVTALLLLHL